MLCSGWPACAARFNVSAIRRKERTIREKAKITAGPICGGSTTATTRRRKDRIFASARINNTTYMDCNFYLHARHLHAWCYRTTTSGAEKPKVAISANG